MQRTSRRTITRRTKTIVLTAKSAFRHLDQAGYSVGKWIITDHAGLSQSLLNMPALGFWASCRYIFTSFLITLAGVFVSGILLFLLITFGLPLLITILIA
ncbi:MAG: hypothetical protein IPJ12_07455 [Betaproteobacteria bacterium]|nr:hypothetical protein [Betaproteobacteria bacterium]